MARTYGSFSEHTAPKVFNSALRLFATHGYAAVSMRQIARDVGVQVGTIYNYVPDKQFLLFKIISDHMESLLAARELESQVGENEQQIQAFIKWHIDFHLNKRDQIIVASMELRNLSEPNLKLIEGQRRQYENKLQKILKAGSDAGMFCIGDTKMTTLALIGMLKEIANSSIMQDCIDATEIKVIYQEIVERFLGVRKYR